MRFVSHNIRGWAFFAVFPVTAGLFAACALPAKQAAVPVTAGHLAARAPAAEEAALPITEAEFRALVGELAPKVNLFSEVWRQDPAAEFYGGTTRDYHYWVLRQFRGVRTRKEAERVIRRLRAMGAIDVREFILEDSDVDVVGARERISIDPKVFGIRKLDFIDPSLFDPKSELGSNELHQGYVPVEKIRLSRAGISTLEGFKDGVHEIYTGNLTVHFAPEEEFWKTRYALAKENHPILLALRYLRSVAVDYYQRHGVDYPVEVALDPESEQAVRRVIDSARDARALQPFFKSERFTTWLNASIQKAFRSYSSPTAAFHLMKRFGVDELLDLYPEIEPFYHYLFVQKRDEAAVYENFKRFGFEPSEVYRDLEKYLLARKLYHGAKTEEAFKGILLRGILRSEGGSAGAGCYGVGKNNVSFAVKWGGARNRVVAITLKPQTRLIDVTKGRGWELWERFRDGRSGTEAGKYDAFAHAFGADILFYPYQTKAFALKNAGMIEKVEGYTRNIRPFSEILERAQQVKSFPEFNELIKEAELFPRTVIEYEAILRALPEARPILDEIRRNLEKSDRAFFRYHRNLRATLYKMEPALREHIQARLMKRLLLILARQSEGEELSSAWEKWARAAEDSLVFERMHESEIVRLFDETPSLAKELMGKEFSTGWAELFKIPETKFAIAEYWAPKAGQEFVAAVAWSAYRDFHEKYAKMGTPIPAELMNRLFEYGKRYRQFYSMGLFLEGVPNSREFVLRVARELGGDNPKSRLEFLKTLDRSYVGVALAGHFLETGAVPIKDLDAILEDWYLERHIDASPEGAWLVDLILPAKRSLELVSARKILGLLFSKVYPSSFDKGDFEPYDFRHAALERLPKHWLESDAFATVVEEQMFQKPQFWDWRKFLVFSSLYFGRGWHKTESFRRLMDRLAATIRSTPVRAKGAHEQIVDYLEFLGSREINEADPKQEWFKISGKGAGVKNLFAIIADQLHDTIETPYRSVPPDEKARRIKKYYRVAEAIARKVPLTPGELSEGFGRILWEAFSPFDKDEVVTKEFFPAMKAILAAGSPVSREGIDTLKRLMDAFEGARSDWRAAEIKKLLAAAKTRDVGERLKILGVCADKLKRGP